MLETSQVMYGSERLKTYFTRYCVRAYWFIECVDSRRSGHSLKKVVRSLISTTELSGSSLILF
jgi:hypothetical protein